MRWILRTIRMTDGLYTMAVRDAKATGRTINGWLREAVAEKLGVSLSELDGESDFPTRVAEVPRAQYQSTSAFKRYSHETE